MSKPTPASLLNRLPSTRVKRNVASAKSQRNTHRPPINAAEWIDIARQRFDEHQLDQARSAAEQARDLARDSSLPWFLLGEIEARSDNAKEAIAHYREAIKRDNKLADAHHGLAKALFRVEELEDALKHCDAALNIAPRHLRAKTIKALVLTRLYRHAEAIELLQTLIEADSQQASVYLTNMGNAQRDIGRLAEAEQSYRKAVALQPSDINAWSNLLTLLHYMPERTSTEIEKTCREIGALFARNSKSARPIPRDRTPNKRLRLGMFSDGFRQHPVGAMTTTSLEQLVKQGVEIYAYSTTSVSDYITERIQAFCASWQVVTSLTDDQFIQQIREDEIDMLIDLAGYGAGTHMRALTQEPAPLIIKWVGGLINTTGVESIDYLISDAIESPPGVDHTYTEKLIRMPDDYICYMPPARVPPVGPLPALKNGYVTFGCFNNPTKINHIILAEWARLLNLVPEARILLKGGPYDSPIMRKMVQDVMIAHGVAVDRIHFSGYSLHYQLFEAYNEVDIALDPWPYSGGLTTCEAMLMGVPVVTLPGPTFAGRHSATHLINAGMSECVATDWDAYRDCAISLASDLDALAKLRGELRQKLLSSPVCDAARFAGNLANALRAIWQRYCEGKPPAALSLGNDGSARFEGDDQPIKLQHPPLAPEEAGFQWNLPGKIIAIDSSGRLLERPSTEGMLSLHMLEMVAFDPISKMRNHALIGREGVHHQTGLALGDGQPATFFDCLDPDFSGVLRPLAASTQDTSDLEGGKVLFQRPLPTISLDSINGLPSVDWLLLDTLDTVENILEHGVNTAAQALVIDARVAFLATHERQPTLSQLEQWAAQHGFRLHRLQMPVQGHATSLPGSQTLPPTALLRADALFVPDRARLATLDAGRRQKLACILHIGYGLEDITYEILAGDPQAQDYLDDRHIAKALDGDMVVALQNVRNRNEANEAVRIASSVQRWSGLAIDVLIKRCLSMLDREPGNDTAHLLLTHALLAKGEFKPSQGVTPELIAQQDFATRLRNAGWTQKGTLYSRWFEDARILRANRKPKISVVLVADRAANTLGESIQALLGSAPQDIEIILLNNGAPAERLAGVMDSLDVYVETLPCASLCIARNIASLYASAPILLFIGSDVHPAAGLVAAHLTTHRDHDAVTVRGACQIQDKNVTAPEHYHLGNAIIESPPTLESNVSFSRAAFLQAGGWGDYLINEYAGKEIGDRLLQQGHASARLLYTPDAIVRTDGSDAASHIADKYPERGAPWLLLTALASPRGRLPAQAHIIPLGQLAAADAPVAPLPGNTPNRLLKNHLMCGAVRPLFRSE
ncbi:O-linked N-acetylglucosamine transferase family protein [Achromobacter aloeverae]